MVFKHCPAGLGQHGMVGRNPTLEPNVTPVGQSAGTPDLCHSLHGRIVRKVKERFGEPLLQHPLFTIVVSVSLGVEGGTTTASSMPLRPPRDGDNPSRVSLLLSVTSL